MQTYHQIEQKLPLGSQLLRWTQSGLRVDERRILAEQKRHDYFGVREEAVEPERAVKLPKEMLFTGPMAAP